MVRASEIDVDDGLEAVVGDPADRRREVARGVVDDDVQPPMSVHNLRDDALHLLGLAYVTRHPHAVQTFTLELVAGRLEILLLAAGDAESSPVPPEGPRNLFAEAGGTAGYERDPAREDVIAKRAHRWPIHQVCPPPALRILSAWISSFRRSRGSITRS